jgi:hypothetical protein
MFQSLSQATASNNSNALSFTLTVSEGTVGEAWERPNKTILVLRLRNKSSLICPVTFEFHPRFCYTFLFVFSQANFVCICIHTSVHEEPDSVLGIATGYGLDDRGVEVQVGWRIFLFSTSSRSDLGSTQPPIQWLTGALPPGVKRPGREADHSPPASAEVKKMWIYTSTLPYAFMA